MKAELLVIPECPGAERASLMFRAALDDVGLPELGFTVRHIESEEVARALGLVGSPAFVLDGIDLFSVEGSRGSMACRVYATPDGPRNVPTLSDLRQALQRRLFATQTERRAIQDAVQPEERCSSDGPARHEHRGDHAGWSSTAAESTVGSVVQ